MPASITISSPAPTSTVPLTFPASGTYTFYTTPTITLLLLDSSGATVATGGPVTASGGNWAGPIFATQAYNNATVKASIDGTTATAFSVGITVQ